MIIGFLGESRTGKDWLRSQITEGLGLNPKDITVVRAADILKLEAERLCPNDFSIKIWESSGDNYRDGFITIPSFDTSSEEIIKTTRRGLLLILGDHLKSIKPSYVEDYLKDSLHECETKHTLIPDLRNSDEVNAVRSVSTKAVIIKVQRHYMYRYPAIWKTYTDGLYHSSLGSGTGFKNHVFMNHSKLHHKLHHHTETSIEEVSSQLISFKFVNSPSSGSKRSLQSLIMKLRPMSDSTKMI